MSDQPVRFTPLGNLDKDSEYKLVGKGNYIDALDIIKQDDSSQVSGTIQPTQRNKHAFSLGSVQAQNKKYRVTVDGDATKSHAIKFLSTKRDRRITTGSGTGGSVAFDGTIASLQSQFNASNLPGAFQVTVSGNTIEFELVAYNYYQWYLESVGEDDVSVVCIQEAIPTDLAGPLKDIGSYDLLGDLFVFSTTQDNEPTEIEAEIIGVGPNAPNLTPPPAFVFGGPLTTLTFNAEHGLQEGQWIRITDSTAPWLNGTFVVNSVTSPTGIEIVTDTAWGASHEPHIIGQEKTFIHPVGIGEIGVAQKNNSTESWDYTRLLRSVELNFVSKHKIDCHSHEDSVGKNVYYTDDYNNPRLFKYRGLIEQDGALNFNNNLNEYSYDSISPQSSLIAVSPAFEFSFVNQSQSGGALMSGNKYYYARLVLPGGDTTGWSSSSPAVSVYDINSNAEPRYIAGDKPVIQTSKSNTLSLTGSSLRFFRGSEVELAVLEEIDGVLSSYIFQKRVIERDEVIFTHTGIERNQIALDVSEIAIQSESFIPVKAKNIRSIDSRNVLSNIETLDKINLTDWVKTFRHSIRKKYITESTKFQKGEYQVSEAVFSDKGFMLNETYRIGCRAYIKGLGKTDVFWVDDIRVDANSINTSNPNDNRRNENDITNYDLVDQINSRNINSLIDGSGSVSVPSAFSGNPYDPPFQSQTGVEWDSWKSNNNREFFLNSDGDGVGSSISRLIVPRIHIEDIDYNFNIEGFGPASEIIDAVEFFIADAPKSVKASGLSVLSVKEKEGEAIPIWRNDSMLDSQLVLQADQIYDRDPYVYEYPFATGSKNGYGDFAVDYPIEATHQGVSKNLEFSAVRDIVSFYSGDTIFNPSGNFSSKKLLVIGVPDLVKNWATRADRALIASLNGNLPDSAYDDDTGELIWENINKTDGFMSVWHPRLTSDKYLEIDVNDYSYIDPTEKFDLKGVGEISSLTIQVGDFPDVVPDLVSVGDEFFAKALPVASGMEGNLSSLRFNLPWKNKMFVGNQMNVARGPVLSLDREIDLSDPIVSGNTSPSFSNNQEVLRYSNRGVFYTQLYTDELDNFESKADTRYFSIGSILLTPSNTSDVSHDLTCGDTHTQTTIVKHRGAGVESLFKRQRDLMAANTQNEQENIEQIEALRLVLGTGFGSGLIFVGQNRVNSNMFAAPDNDEANTSVALDSVAYYPMLEDRDWLERFTWESPPEYDKSYNELPEIYATTYRDDPRLGGSVFDFPARIIYSERKDESGIFDEYRFFLPLNRKDLDRTFGEINHHEDINGELFTIQSRKYQLQYFNTRGTLQSSNSGVEVLIGDGSVLSRDGQTLSSYGTDHKWSVVKGSSQGGKDVIYWFNQENGLFMRFGADGTVVLSERHGIRSFAANDTRWTENQYTPALNYGIRSVWDDRFKEAIWTFIGVRASKGAWGTLPSNQLYSEGATVTGVTFDNYSFDGIPDVYISLSLHFPIPQSEPGVGSDWETYWKLADKDDPEYYSVFTLAFNELSNGFSTFYSHIPKTYLKWKNKFLSSHPTERSEIYEHRYGYDKWYEYEGAWKESEPYLEGVVNPFPDQSKKFVAIQALTDNVPDRIELKTKDHESFLVATDFDPEDDAWRTPIKNDILTSQTGDPNDDTVSLIGSYMRVKFKFFNGAYNKMNNLVVKVRQRLRRTQS
jgi:hypothetical protein